MKIGDMVKINEIRDWFDNQQYANLYGTIIEVDESEIPQALIKLELGEKELDRWFLPEDFEII